MFDIKARGSTVSREVLGGITTFMAMSYILFVQPAVLSKAGMDGGAVFMATCISGGIACILMGLWANYPIALAPGMGENFFFVFTLCGVGAAAGAFKLSWAEALALTCFAGVLFLSLSLVGFRSRVLNAIPDALKSGIAAGIGLFIALIGFEWGNIVRTDPVTGVALANMQNNYVALLTLIGLGITLTLTAFHVRGAILIGILLTTAITWGYGQVWGVASVRWQGFVGYPSGLGETAGAFAGGFASLAEKIFGLEFCRLVGQWRIWAAMKALWQTGMGTHWLDIIIFAFILLFMDLFDTVGTLVGVAGRAGLMVNGKLPRAERALASDAAGTVVGSCFGTSTVTSYIESITGVQAGARTGLAAIVVGICMFVAMLFQPLVMMVGGGVKVGQFAWGDPILRYPMIAPALIIVGGMMIRTIRGVDWDDVTESLPAFLTMVVMPFAYSISAGIAMGFIAYAFGKLVTGRVKECPIIVYVFAALFIVRYAIASV